MVSVGGPATRRLWLMRHAHAGFAASDRERPLTAAGLAEARRLGVTIANRGIERVLCSPATRTRQTADALRLKAPLTIIEPLYDCSAGRILGVLATLPEHVTSALVVGHYPGIPSLAHQLADRRTSDAAEIRRLTGPFLPATLVELEFSGAWGELHTARLVAVHRPPD